jgi:hypothetical protein
LTSSMEKPLDIFSTRPNVPSMYRHFRQPSAMGRKCVVCGRRDKDNNVSTHSFPPKDSIERIAWISFVKQVTGKELKTNNLNNRTDCVCSRHFEAEQFLFTASPISSSISTHSRSRTLLRKTARRDRELPVFYSHLAALWVGHLFLAR